MKKLVTLIAISVMAALLFCGCKLGECDLCGETGILSEYSFFGTSIYLCSDCAD